MSYRSLLPVLAAVALVGAGCAEPEREPAGDEDIVAQPDASTRFVYSAHNTSLVRVYANPVLQSDQERAIAFNVTENVVAILVELVWDDPLQDLDARLSADVDDCPWQDEVDRAVCSVARFAGDDSLQFGVFQNWQGNPGAGDSPSRLLVEGEDLQEVVAVCGSPCDWWASPWARAVPIVNVEWWLYATVFYGAVPDGYTALPA